METANILMCANAEYAQHLAVSLVSLLENNDWGHFNIVVVGSQELIDESKKIRDSLNKYSNFEMEFRDRPLDEGIDLPLRKHYSVDMYSRIWVSNYFSEETKRVLYLDSDLIVVDSIKELYNHDIGNNVVGAVSIAGSDALNACLYEQRYPLDYVWNVISPYFWDDWESDLSPEDLCRIRRDAKIVHFNGASKPWSFHNRHPRKADYYKYLSLTEWKDFVPADRTPVDRLKYVAASTLPTPILRMLRRLL